MLNNISPAGVFVSHIGQAGGKGLSPQLWTRANGQALTPDGSSYAYECGDNFMNFGDLATAANNHQGYGIYIDTTCTVQQMATEVGGVIQMATHTDANDEVWMTSGGNKGVLGVISDTAADAKLLIFEARVRFPQIGDTYNAFIGLAEEGLAAANTIADDPSTAYIADKDHIGFLVNEGDGNNLMFVYNKDGAGVTAQTTVKIAALQALVAGTWHKLGFVYDPDAITSKRIKIFVDNVEQTTYVTGANIAAALFPDGQELAFLAGIKNGDGSAQYLDMDWWNFWQLG